MELLKYDGTTSPIREAVSNVSALVARAGGRAVHGSVSPSTFLALLRWLGCGGETLMEERMADGRTRLVVSGPLENVGEVVLHAPSGPVTLTMSRDLADGHGTLYDAAGARVAEVTFSA